LCPFGAGSRIDADFHGLRSVRLSADIAPPVATVRRPFGARTGTGEDSGCEAGRQPARRSSARRLGEASQPIARRTNVSGQREVHFGACEIAKAATNVKVVKELEIVEVPHAIHPRRRIVVLQRDDAHFTFAEEYFYV